MRLVVCAFECVPAVYGCFWLPRVVYLRGLTLHTGRWRHRCGPWRTPHATMTGPCGRWSVGALVPFTRLQLASRVHLVPPRLTRVRRPRLPGARFDGNRPRCPSCTWYSSSRRLRLGTACVAAHTPDGGCDPPAASLGFRVCVLNAAVGGLRLRMRARRGLRLGVRPRPVGPAVCCHGYYLLCQVSSSTLTPSSQDKVRSMISGRVAVAAEGGLFRPGQGATSSRLRCA